MQRAQRAVDNPALDTAIAVGNALRQPVVVFLAPVPFYPHGNLRHYSFLFQGFSELEPALARRRVGLVFRLAPHHRVEAFAEDVNASVVIGDENPMREPAAWRDRVAVGVCRVGFAWRADGWVLHLKRKGKKTF